MGRHKVLGKFSEANGKFFYDKLKSSGLDAIQQLQLRSFLQSIDDSVDSSLFDEIDPDQLVLRKLTNYDQTKKLAYKKGYTPEDQIEAHIDSIREELDEGMYLWQIVIPDHPDVTTAKGALHGETKLGFRQSEWDLHHVYVAVFDYIMNLDVEYRITIHFDKGIEFTVIRRVKT